MTRNKTRVLVAMSGGIDSSVAALLLHEQGYEVVGMTMKTWDYATHATKTLTGKQTGCCDLDAFNDARSVAVAHGFAHYIVDIREQFTKDVIDNFVSEYTLGRTPNPCILCNTHIKWKVLFEKARALHCAYIATGHYAKVRSENGRYLLSQAEDQTKDQSYVLWGLSQEVLKHTLFPLGTYQKTQVRAYAAQRGLQKLSEKKDSYEICFIPDNNYRDFLLKNNPSLAQRLENGLFVDKSGKVLGTHQGYPFFTIGQRKGLGVTFGKPTFVLDIIPDQNKVVLGSEEDLLEMTMTVRQINVIKPDMLAMQEPLLTKIRYRDPGAYASHKLLEGDTLEVRFVQAVKGVAPGQSAVFYDGKDVVAGGIIAKSTPSLAL